MPSFPTLPQNGWNVAMLHYRAPSGMHERSTSSVYLVCPCDSSKVSHRTELTVYE
jgi:hypothetical protein